jgi:hypothetical protein
MRVGSIVVDVMVPARPLPGSVSFSFPNHGPAQLTTTGACT